MSDDLPPLTGYKNPPTKHQFAKGQSGNPKGRPKKPVDINATLQKVLNRKFKVAGGSQYMPVHEALIRKLRDLALDGDKRALALQRQILEEAPAHQPEPARPVEIGPKVEAMAARLGLTLPQRPNPETSDE